MSLHQREWREAPSSAEEAGAKSLKGQGLKMQEELKQSLVKHWLKSFLPEDWNCNLY
jgi:hypothetical protein